MQIGSQRAGDFLNNQLRGQWAEKVVLSMPINDLIIRQFGPSGAAMPGDQDHREIVATFREIMVMEGKRPDLIAFDTLTWDAFSNEERQKIEEWPSRRLVENETEIIKKAVCGIEVKNAAWHYAKRRQSGGGLLSIVIKDEEISQIARWSELYSTQVIFVQVFFDEIYCMSFNRMQQAIKRGFVYNPNDYIRDKDTGAGRKIYHKFHVNKGSHYCGETLMPIESKAIIKVLDNGCVMPYINLSPAKSLNVSDESIWKEINFK